MDTAAASRRRRQSVMAIQAKNESEQLLLSSLRLLKKSTVTADNNADFGKLVRNLPPVATSSTTTNSSLPTAEEDEENAREFKVRPHGWWEEFTEDEADLDLLLSAGREKIRRLNFSSIIEPDEKVLFETTATMLGTKRSRFRLILTSKRYIRLAADECIILSSTDLSQVLSIDPDPILHRVGNVVEKKDFSMRNSGTGGATTGPSCVAGEGGGGGGGGGGGDHHHHNGSSSGHGHSHDIDSASSSSSSSKPLFGMLLNWRRKKPKSLAAGGAGASATDDNNSDNSSLNRSSIGSISELSSLNSGNNRNSTNSGVFDSGSFNFASGSSIVFDEDRKIEREGWVEKKGGMHGGRRNWKRKYCILKDETMKFFDSEDKAEEDKEGDGKTATSGGKLTLKLKDFVEFVGRTHKVNGIALRHVSGHDFHMVFEDEMSYNEWTADIKTAMAIIQARREEEDRIRDEEAKARRKRFTSDFDWDSKEKEEEEEEDSSGSDAQRKRILSVQTQKGVVLKEGYVYKKTGRKGGLVHNWKRRFVEISDGQVFIYRSHMDRRPKGRLPLSGCVIVEDTHKMYGLQIKLPGVKELNLAFENGRDWKDWLDAFQTGISLLAKAAEEQNGVQKEGFLLKKGGTTGSGRRAWNRRYIVIRKGMLQAYRHEADPSPSASFSLSQCHLVKHTHKEFGFCLRSPGRPEFHLQAESEEMYHEWIAALEAGIARRETLETTRRGAAAIISMQDAVRATMDRVDDLGSALMYRNVTKQFEFPDEGARNAFLLLARGAARDLWQKHFETSIMQKPEIYQCHSRCVKINHHRQEQRERWIVLSSTLLYNVDIIDEGVLQIKPKWGISIDRIMSIAIDNSDERLFAIQFSGGGKFKPAPKHTIYGFKLDNNVESALFVSDLCRLYQQATRTQLIVHRRCPEIFDALLNGGDVALAFRHVCRRNSLDTNSLTSNLINLISAKFSTRGETQFAQPLLVSSSTNTSNAASSITLRRTVTGSGTSTPGRRSSIVDALRSAIGRSSSVDLASIPTLGSPESSPNIPSEQTITRSQSDASLLKSPSAVKDDNAPGSKPSVTTIDIGSDDDDDDDDDEEDGMLTSPPAPSMSIDDWLGSSKDSSTSTVAANNNNNNELTTSNTNSSGNSTTSTNNNNISRERSKQSDDDDDEAPPPPAHDDGHDFAFSSSTPPKATKPKEEEEDADDDDIMPPPHEDDDDHHHDDNGRHRRSTSASLPPPPEDYDSDDALPAPPPQ